MSLCRTPQSDVLKLGSQNAIDNFYIPPGTQAIMFEAEMIYGRSDSVFVNVFGPDGNGRAVQALIHFKPNPGQILWMASVGIQSPRRGASSIRLDYRVRPIQMKLEDEVIRPKQSVVRLSNYSSALQGVMEIKPLQLLNESYSTSRHTNKQRSNGPFQI